jgi:D-serine dehydratase
MFSGLSVGLLGARVGIHNSLAMSAAALAILYSILFLTRYLRSS